MPFNMKALVRMVAKALAGAAHRAAPFEIVVYRSETVEWVVVARPVAKPVHALPTGDGAHGPARSARRRRRSA
jgi:hypothetical protein